MAAKNIAGSDLGLSGSVVDPKSIEAGAQDWNISCGVCHVGGGQMEYDRDRNPYSASSPTGDRYVYEIAHVQGGSVVPGRLIDVYNPGATAYIGAMSDDNKAEVDCLMCHMAAIKPMMKYYISQGCNSSNPMGPNSDRNCDGVSANWTDGTGNTIVENSSFGPAVDNFAPGTAYDMMNRNAAIKARNLKNAASAGLGATINTRTGEIVAGTAPTIVAESSILATPSSNSCAVCHARNEDTIGVTSYGTSLGMKAGYGNYWQITEATEGYDIDNPDLNSKCMMAGYPYSCCTGYGTGTCGDHLNDHQWFEFGCKTGMGKRAHRTGIGINEKWGLSTFNLMFNLGRPMGSSVANETLTATLMGMPFGTVTTKERIPDTDVHDASGQGMQCATCHYALGSKKSNPAATLVGSGEGQHETFPGVTRHGVAYPSEDVWAVDHNFAQADSQKDTYGKNNLDDTVSCAGCHTTRTHPNLTDNGGSLVSPTPAHTGIPQVHFDKIHCTTCHIPEVYSAPARLKYRDWTVGYFKNLAFRNILDWNYDMVTGSHTPMPVIRGWGSTEEGPKIKPLLPSLLPIWNGTIGTQASPVKNRDVGQAVRNYEDANGGANNPLGINVNHGNVYPLFDGFQLGDAWMIDTKPKVDAIATQLSALGITNPYIKINIGPFDVTHGVVPKEWALGGSKRGGCISCHSSMDPFTRDVEGLPAGSNPNYSPNSVGFFEGYQQPLNNLLKDPTNPMSHLPAGMIGIGKYDLAKNWVSIFADFDCTGMCISSGMGNDEPFRMSTMSPNTSWNGAWDMFGAPVTTFSTFDGTKQCESMSTMEYFRGKGFFDSAPYTTLGMCTQFMNSAFDTIMGFPPGTAAMMGFHDGIAGLQGFVTEQGAPHDCDPFSGTVNFSPKNNYFGNNFASVNACLPSRQATLCMDDPTHCMTGLETPGMWTNMIQGTCVPDTGVCNSAVCVGGSKAGDACPGGTDAECRTMTQMFCDGGFKDGAMCLTVGARATMIAGGMLPPIGVSNDNADCEGGNMTGMFINGRDTARSRNDIHIQQSVVGGVYRQSMPFSPANIALVPNPDNPSHSITWDQAKDSKCGAMQNEPCCKNPMTGMPTACADGMEVRTDIHANQLLGFDASTLASLMDTTGASCTACHTQKMTTLNHPTGTGTPTATGSCTTCHMSVTSQHGFDLASGLPTTLPTKIPGDFVTACGQCHQGATPSAFAIDTPTLVQAAAVIHTSSVNGSPAMPAGAGIAQCSPVSLNRTIGSTTDAFQLGDNPMSTFNGGLSGTVYIDWGDGSAMTTMAAGATSGGHTYANIGTYKIRKTVQDNTFGISCYTEKEVTVSNLASIGFGSIGVTANACGGGALANVNVYLSIGHLQFHGYTDATGALTLPAVANSMPVGTYTQTVLGPRGMTCYSDAACTAAVPASVDIPGTLAVYCQ